MSVRRQARGFEAIDMQYAKGKLSMVSGLKFWQEISLKNYKLNVLYFLTVTSSTQSNSTNAFLF